MRWRFDYAALLALAVFLPALGAAQTKIAVGKIAEVSERGFVIMIGTEPLALQDESNSRFWKERAVSTREAFKVGDSVNVRIKTDASPAVLREIADPATAEWLAVIRKEVVPGTVHKVDLRGVTLKLDSGGEFTYRYSEKSQCSIGGKAASPTDFKEGQKLYVKGRLLPNLDTWMVSATDVKPPAAAAKAPKKSPQPAQIKLAPAGTITAPVDGHQPQFKMFDLRVQERPIHFTYNASTKFTLTGQPSTAQAIRKGMRAEVTYKRDSFGRLIASKVELSEAPGT